VLATVVMISYGILMRAGQETVWRVTRGDGSVDKRRPLYQDKSSCLYLHWPCNFAIPERLCMLDDAW